jgi:uncharacterized membrane protein
MTQEKFCQDCNQKHNCREVYQKLSDTTSPSVAAGAVVAFLLPILVFIGSLAAFEAILAKTGLSFLLALFVTSVCILIIKVINRQLSKNK